MDNDDTMSSDTAQKLLDRSEPMTPAEQRQLLRFLKRANDDLVGKMRMLKSEIGRVARK